MADTHETIADIIAEMRGIRVREFQDYADRFEAAHRRERGDAAKLREAVVQAELFVGNIVRHGHQTLVPGDKCTACDGAEELRDMICAALAAPATTAPMRNCDRFKTAAEAIDAYQDLTGDQLATDSGMKEWVEFAVWLFATATEKEGGAK